jgi:hypothetical protein
MIYGDYGKDDILHDTKFLGLVNLLKGSTLGFEYENICVTRSSS